MHERIAFTIVLFFSLLLCGCSKPEPAEEIAIQIMVPETVNGGSPFYCVASEAAVSEFYMNDYQKIANIAFGESEKEVTKEVLIPGRIQTVRMPIKEPGKPLTLYFLFTTPSEEWKIILDNPDYRHYKILLGGSEILEAYGY